MPEAEPETIKCGMLADYPGHWMMSVTTGDADRREWSVVRKPDGTYWHVAHIDFFPRSGGTMNVETGDPVVEAKALAYVQRCYAKWMEKLAEQRTA
jgi:hypothetical protein